MIWCQWLFLFFFFHSLVFSDNLKTYFLEAFVITFFLTKICVNKKFLVDLKLKLHLEVTAFFQIYFLFFPCLEVILCNLCCTKNLISLFFFVSIWAALLYNQQPLSFALLFFFSNNSLAIFFPFLWYFSHFFYFKFNPKLLRRNHLWEKNIQGITEVTS